MRDFSCNYLTRLCHMPEVPGASQLPPVPAPELAELAVSILAAPPMQGLEYLNPSCLVEWWSKLGSLVRRMAQESGTENKNSNGARTPKKRGKTLPDSGPAGGFQHKVLTASERKRIAPAQKKAVGGHPGEIAIEERERNSALAATCQKGGVRF